MCFLEWQQISKSEIKRGPNNFNPKTILFRYGRKNPLIASIVLQVLAGIMTAFIPGYYLFLLLRFIDALATGGMMVTSFVICKFNGRDFRRN